MKKTDIRRRAIPQLGGRLDDISEITVSPLMITDEYMEIRSAALGENSTAFREILERKMSL